jgi:hypothetical protein
LCTSRKRPQESGSFLSNVPTIPQEIPETTHLCLPSSSSSQQLNLTRQTTQSSSKKFNLKHKAEARKFLSLAQSDDETEDTERIPALCFHFTGFKIEQ